MQRIFSFSIFSIGLLVAVLAVLALSLLLPLGAWSQEAPSPSSEAGSFISMLLAEPNLLQNSNLSQDLKQELNKKLSSASDFLSIGDIKSAVNELKAYVNALPQEAKSSGLGEIPDSIISIASSSGALLSPARDKFDILESMVANAKEAKANLPKVSKVFANYPNPFNPETWIPFQLSEAAKVTVQIYNAQGKLVRRLDLGQKEAGYYLQRNKAIYWDGRDQNGDQVASGIYFYTLQAGSYKATKKMVILK